MRLAVLKYGDVVREFAASKGEHVAGEVQDGSKPYTEEVLEAVGRQPLLLVSLGERNRVLVREQCRCRVIKIRGSGKTFRLASIGHAATMMVKELVAFRPELIVVIDGGNFALGPFVFACTARVPLILAVPQQVVGSSHLARIRQYLVRAIANSETTVAVLARGWALKDELMAIGVRPGKIVSYFPSYQSDLVQLRRVAAIEGPDRPRVVYLGRLSEVKGASDLLLVAETLEKRALGRLVVIGDGPLRQLLEKEAASRGLAHRIEFRGALPHPCAMRELAMADVMVMPSRQEGLGKAAMEAMILGVPVVAYAVGGITEIIQHRKSGVLVEPRNARRLCEEVAELLANLELRARLAEGARLVGDKFIELRPTLGDVLRFAMEPDLDATAHPTPLGAP